MFEVLPVTNSYKPVLSLHCEIAVPALTEVGSENLDASNTGLPTVYSTFLASRKTLASC